MEEKPIRASELFILVAIILINFLDFFEVLTGDIDFIVKVMSLLLMGYFLYRVSLTKLFFGVRSRYIDILIIIAYSLLIAKDMIGYINVSGEDVTLLKPIYDLLAKHSVIAESVTSYGKAMMLSPTENKLILELFLFYFGGILLILVSILMTFLLEVRVPSLMDVIHEKGHASTIGKKLERFTATFLVLIFFFIIVFNLVMEWLAIVIGTSLIVFAFIFYMCTLFRSHFRKLSPKSFIYKVGEFGEDFYEDFVALFHSKKKIYLGISGLLVLHLLTDVANFIIPYILGLYDMLYFGHFGEGHEPIYVLFIKDTKLAATLLQKVYISWIYLFNIFAMLFLLILPAYIWYKLYSRKGFFVTNNKISIFFVSVLIFILAPIFEIKEIKVKGLTGVDIITSQLPSNINIPIVVLSTLLFGILIYLLSFNHSIKEKLIAIGIILVDIFFAFYIFYFFKSSASYYIETIKFLLFNIKKYFIAAYFIFFFIILTLFYVIGFIIFLSETKKEFRYIQ